jgi:hypothetical protein
LLTTLSNAFLYRFLNCLLGIPLAGKLGMRTTWLLENCLKIKIFLEWVRVPAEIKKGLLELEKNKLFSREIKVSVRFVLWQKT